MTRSLHPKEENRELIKEGRQKRIDDLTNKYEETTDQSDKEKIKSTLETLKSSMNYSFITERLDNIGEDEVDNIVHLCLVLLSSLS